MPPLAGWDGQYNSVAFPRSDRRYGFCLSFSFDDNRSRALFEQNCYFGTWCKAAMAGFGGRFWLEIVAQRRCRWAPRANDDADRCQYACGGLLIWQLDDAQTNDTDPTSSSLGAINCFHHPWISAVCATDYYYVYSYAQLVKTEKSQATRSWLFRQEPSSAAYYAKQIGFRLVGSAHHREQCPDWLLQDLFTRSGASRWRRSVHGSWFLLIWSWKRNDWPDSYFFECPASIENIHDSVKTIASLTGCDYDEFSGTNTCGTL